jgi:hypothetical protein
MRSPILVRVAMVTTLALAMAATAPAQSSNSNKFSGTINDYSDIANTVGAWHITGTWSAHIVGKSGKANFVASLGMLRNGTGGGPPHTHHVTLNDATATATANGYLISGIATITGSGNLAGFSGTTVNVALTGGAEVMPSNISITFTGGAIGHFGPDPVDGVVIVEP